jgi:hypothetical protein
MVDLSLGEYFKKLHITISELLITFLQYHQFAEKGNTNLKARKQNLKRKSGPNSKICSST